MSGVQRHDASEVSGEGFCPRLRTRDRAAVVFFVSWILQSATGWVQATMENWQSEFLQLFTMVVVTGFLIHRGSEKL